MLIGVGGPVVGEAKWIFPQLRTQVLSVKMYFHWLFTFRLACKSGAAIEKHSRSHLARGSTSVLP